MAVGHHAIVEMLARSLGPGNVDLRLNDGKTALMLACKNGFAEVAAELLNFGADPNLQESNDADGFSAIMHAALYGHHECIAVVLRHVKKKVVEVEADLLQRVSLHSNKRGSLAPAVQTRNKNGDTALHLASLFGQRKVVQLLLRERADVNALNEKGETALHNASKNSHAQVACALMTGGAEVNTQDRDHGYAALHYCCISNGGKDVADALMEVGAEVDLVGMDGNTPLHLACMSGNHGVVDAMMKRKARSCHRSMSLHSSATMLCPLYAQAAFKAAVAVRNKSGEFPFNAAAKAGHNNVKEKLQPIRHTLESHLTRIDSVQQFKKARAFVRDYSVQRLKHELSAPPHPESHSPSPCGGVTLAPARVPVAPGFVDPKTNRLTTTLAPVNVFALVGAGHPKFQANKDDNEALKKANPAYAEQFMVARNMPANDASWNSDDPAHVGKASMSKRHRYDGCASNKRRSQMLKP